jgi:hypothetical protein
MPESYCRSCYRGLPPGQVTCFACDGDRRRLRVTSRLPLIIGCIGVPLLIMGMLTLSVRMCFAGAIVSGCAALAHALMTLRSD